MKQRQDDNRDPLKRLLRRNDPAGVIHPVHCARLENAILQRIMAEPQKNVSFQGRFGHAFVPVLQGFWPWPTALGITLALGLCLGFVLSSASNALGSHYTLTTAMVEPWQLPQ